MNDFNRRYDFDRQRRRSTGGLQRLQAVLILLAVVAVTGALIYFFVIPHDESTNTADGSDMASAAENKNPDRQKKPAVVTPPPDPTAPLTGDPASGANSGVSGDPSGNTASDAGNATSAPPAPEAAPEETEVKDPLERAITVEVKAGNTLSGLAREHHATEEAIKYFNRDILKNRPLQPGMKLKIIPGPWRMTVNRSRHELVLEHAPKQKWQLFKKFSAFPTISNGRFVVYSRSGDGDYRLNLAPFREPKKRLIGFSIHGVADKPLDTEYCGAGSCIHVRGDDIKLLFLLCPAKSEVTVIPGASPVQNSEN